MILSPYTNHELRGHLKLKEYNRATTLITKLLGVSSNISGFKDIAPWVGQIIHEFEKHSDIELFAVAPHIKLKKSIETFKIGRTSYYFYSSEYSSALRLLNNYHIWKKLQNCSRIVSKIADTINPDVIISYGTENPVNSFPAIQLNKKYPVITVLQTIYNNPDRYLYSTPNRLIQELEYDVVKNVDYFGTSFNFYNNLLRQMKKDAVVLKYQFLSSPFPKVNKVCKIFDFVNYAFNMDLRKGDEDSIRALALVKKKYPNVTLNIAGGIAKERKEYLVKLISELDLTQNISFTGMFERKEEMYQHIVQARFAVLPVKMDLISTTMKESMYYKIPVVTNVTPETPHINRDKKRMLIAEKGNIDSLADKMIRLLEDQSLAKELADNGYEYMLSEMDNDKKVETILNVLTSIIANFNQNKPIEQSLLMN